MGNRIPRFCPHRPLPAGTFVPGRSARKARFEQEEIAGERDAFLYGVDLFHAGCYWEAHEVWEGVWKRRARSSRDARALQGLIKLAAAGVKFREGRPDGVRRHLRSAIELLSSVLKEQAEGDELDVLCGMPLDALVKNTEDFLQNFEAGLCVPDGRRDDRGDAGTAGALKAFVVFPFLLLPIDPANPD